jgi:hypothetical protein
LAPRCKSEPNTLRLCQLDKKAANSDRQSDGGVLTHIISEVEVPGLTKLWTDDDAKKNERLELCVPCDIRPTVCVDKEWGGESVSQSPLKGKAFSNFVDPNPLFELRRENEVVPARTRPHPVLV